MTSPFQPKQVQVPGILSDDALNERLKQFADNANAQQNAAPPPNSAVEFSEKIKRDFLQSPEIKMQREKSPRLQKQDTAIDVRSDILKDLAPEADGVGSTMLRNLILGPIVGTFGEGGVGEKMGILSDDERQAEAENRAEDAKVREQAVNDKAAVRAKLRGMSDEEAANLGLPLAPGGTRVDEMHQLEERDEKVRETVAKDAESKEKAVTDKAAQPTQAWWLNAIRSGYKGFVDVGLDVARAGPIAWELTAGRVLNGGDIERSDARAWVDTVDAMIEKTMPGDKARSKDFVTQLSQGGGSMAAFMLGGFVARMAGLPASTATMVIGAASGGSSQFREAEEFGAVGWQKYASFIAGAGLGLTEAIPIDRMFLRADQMTGGLVRRMLANTASSSLEEFIQEFGQSVGSDVVAKLVYDETREMDVRKWAQQGLIGAITGGVAGASAQIIQEAGVTPNPPTGNPVDDAQREEAANLVIDVLQDRFDKMTATEEVAPDIALSAEEAADAIIAGEGPVLQADNATFEGYVAADDIVEPGAADETLADIGTTERAEPVVTGRGGTVPVNERGMVELRHFSTEARDEIDPAQRGTGPLRGEERARLGPRPVDGEGDTDVVDRSYFGVGTPPGASERTALERELRAADRLPVRAELNGEVTYPRFEAHDRAYRKYSRQRGYKKEGGLGDIRHDVEVRPDAIYNAFEDPLNLRSTLDPELSSAERTTRFERLVRDAGFEGIYYAESKLGQVATMFTKTTPTRVVDERTGLNIRYEVTDPKTVALDRRDTQPLPGLTTSSGPVPSVVQAARAYAAARGLPARRQAEYVKVDTDRATRIAEAYDKMKHAPNNPKVKAAYQAMADETLAQYQFVKATGLEIEAIEPGQADPYPEGPKQVLEDLARGHLWFYPTDQGFGSSDADVSGNPLLAPTDEFIDGRQLVVNDVFRIVHDFFGHGIEGSGFGARGEENAWQSHMRLYSEAALPAVTSETRGQNSWVNFGPYGERNRMNQRETVYADQKTGIMPEWTWREGVADDDSAPDLLARVGDPVTPEKQNQLMDTVPGLRNVLPYMTPEEQGRVRAANAKKLVDMVEQLPSAEEMASVAFSGRAKRGWYRRSAQALLDIFGLEDAPRFSGLLAALSPQTSVETNTVNALNIWTAWVRAGRPMDKAGATKAIKAGLMGGQALPAWMNNSIEALTNPDVNAINLSGPKVSSFMANLNDVTHEVTNDAWMTNYAGVTDRFVKGQSNKLPSGGTFTGKSLGYIAMSTVVRRAAKIATDLTGEQWTPAEIQETVWSWAKTLYEKSGGGTSAEQLLMAGGMTAEDISNTPDFATLFVSGVYRSILERGGYDLDSVGTGDQRSDGRDAGGRDPLSAEGLGVAQPDFERNLQRAARRLDALRAARQDEARQSGPAEEAVSDGRNQLPDYITDDDVDAFASVGTSVFKKWFGDSKVVDEAGKPLVVYHGTRAGDFEAFDPSKTGEGSDFGWFGEGVYFTPDPEMATNYATIDEKVSTSRRPQGSVYPVYLKVENPYITDQDGISADEVRALREEGYDGIFRKEYMRDATPREIVVFEPTQIKSVNNRGTFDANNPDILASTSAARGPYKAEQTRPDAGIATPAGQEGGDAALSLSKITRNLQKLMDLTLRQGRISMTAKDSFGNKQEVMGEYNRRQDVTRVRTMSDLSTIVHEAGHALYFGASDPLKIFIAANDKQLMDVATALYGGDTKVMPKSTHVAEGFAEFFRVYTLNKAFAQRKYAGLTTAFDAMLDQHDKRLKDGLATVGQQFEAWLQLPSAQLVSGMIVSGAQNGGIGDAIAELREVGFQTWFHEVARKTVEESVNRYAGLDSMINQILNIGERNKGKSIDLKRADDPRALIRLAQNSGARAMVQLTDGVMGYRSVTSETRGLREALLLSQGRKDGQQLSKIDPVRQRDFAAFLVALRGIDEYRRLAEGKIERPPVAATLGDLKITVDEMGAKYPEFAEAAQIVHEYAMGLWKKGYDAGLMNEQTYTDGLDRQFYAPLQRDMSDKKTTFGDGPLTGGKKLVKQFRGSDRDIIDPMDILMHKTFALEQNIARNDVMKTLAQLADKAGKAGALAERIPAQQLIGKQYGIKEIARQLTKDDNLTEADAVDLMTMLEASIQDEKTLALFRSEQASSLGDNVLFFWEDGRLAALQLADGELGSDVVNVVNGLGRENLPLFADLIAATSTAFRSSITLWPDFLAVNFIRDQMSAFILTDVGYKPFWTGLKGVGDELRQKQWAKQYNAAMGIMGGMNTAALHNARVNRDISSLRRKGYVASAFADRSLLGAIKGMARVAELTETGSRLGIFRNAFERAKADGLNDWEASIDASYIATDYMNFGLNGSRMLLARRTIPFLNAQLQGLYKMMRTLGADEVRQRKGLRFALSAFFKSTKNMDLSRTEKAAIQTGRKAWIKMASLGLISAALHFLFEDDPDYQEAGEYLRTTGWVIPMGDGRLMYIPKPFELALVANFTERAFEYASGDETAKARFLRGLAMTMSPPTSPPAIQSVVKYAANRDFFTGQEIVPYYMQALSPELQFNNYTTSFAKQVGDITGWSPMVVDHFMSSLGASAYRDLTGVYNALDPARPEMDATDAPILRRFVRDVRRGSASSKDFWATASTLNGTLRRAETSYKRYLESGNEAGANAFLATLGEDEKAYALLNTHFEADAKRLNPFYRARQISTVVSAMRRELVTAMGLDDTTVKNSGDTIKLSRREKNELDTALSEYVRREMRNTLIAMGAPGWGGKRRLSVDKSLDMIGAIDPRVREELDRRIAKAKVYNAEIVEEYWPELKDRILRDRENTFLDDLVTIAKVTR